MDLGVMGGGAGIDCAAFGGVGTEVDDCD